MNVIKSKVTKYILLASFFIILIMFNNSKVFANNGILIPKGYIDTPSNGVAIKGEMVVSGWFLDASGVSKIEVLIDGKSKGEAQYGDTRNDVAKAYPEYQNTNSGYKFTLNTKDLTNGQHTLTVRETGNNGAENLESVMVNVQNPPVKGYIDTPTNGSMIKGEMEVSGWYLDTSGVSKIEVLVDGKSLGQAQYGDPRSDVAKAYPEYQNTNSGYKYTLNTRKLNNGQHTLTVRETGKNGATNLKSVMVNVQNPPAKGYIDSPKNSSTIKGEMEVRGWFLDVSGVSKIEVLIDGTSIGEAKYGEPRNDVAKVYPEYQNANSGYNFTLNTKNLTNGQHTLTVRETGINGTTNLQSITVNVQNPPAKGYIDTPKNGSTIKGEIDVNGWFLDASGVSKIEVLVDGESMGEAKYGDARNDVAKVYPEYQNTNSGYKFTLNTKNLINGQHTLTVKETGNNGVMNLESVVVNVQNPPAKGYIDTPKVGSAIKGEIEVSGWYLDLSGVSKIEVLVDGKNMGVAKYGDTRTDVANVYPEYQNANSGYKFNLNTKMLTNGQHTLTVRETGNNGATNLESIKVNVQNPPAKGFIDTPKDGSSSKGEIEVSGWFLDVTDVSKIEVFVDGKSMGVAQYGGLRTDVANVYPEYQNTNSGYKLTFNSLQFAEGQHTLAVKETGGNGTTSTVNSIIYIYNGNPYLQIDLRKPANITANDIINFFNQKRPDSPLKNYAQSFIDAQNKYGVNAQYLVAHAIWETGWGGSNLKTYKNNLYGYSAYDSCPFTCGYYFPTGGDSINFEAFIVRRDYLDGNGIYFNGSTLTGMNVRYATDPNWANGIANLMQSIKPFNAGSYFQSDILPTSSVSAPVFGRNIPLGQPYPTSIIINYREATYARVISDGLAFRSIPYVLTSTFLKALDSGTTVRVLGYNTDVREDSTYPYDNRWYRVLVNGLEGWVYGGGIQF
ncbi:cell wall hydrolase/autolysin [Neobacillus bataviensis LMG 21833]|uniref:Cell wall hydrolase/autolysin n=1 Tax=Neobacillus bataviensis LMG 21833 TaxID=1117379 RepID=K6CJJ4_9BACI|nr:Ig-like domain-containing protein [Neobacillus bataviensis]EKN71340.1 cell wall hydrolase/autolysin [Neobacillus bataviensis LMG 21833]